MVRSGLENLCAGGFRGTEVKESACRYVGEGLSLRRAASAVEQSQALAGVFGECQTTWAERSSQGTGARTRLVIRSARATQNGPSLSLDLF